jgi:hypothetical protein
MKITALFEARINNAAQLKDAFTDQEWVNIAFYFVTNRFGEMNDTRFRSQNRYFQRDIGKNMPDDLTPSAWNLKAAVYGASLDRAAAWTSIYNHLNVRKDTENPFDASDISPVQQALTPHDNTPETRSEVNRWVDSNTEEWTDFNTFRSEFWIPWFAALREARKNDIDEDGNSWWSIVFQRQYNGNPVPSKAAIDRMYQRYQTTSPIQKDAVLNELWAWLRNTDNVFQQRVDRQRN